MSKESVQFIEMIRQAVAMNKLPKNVTWEWCEVCLTRQYHYHERHGQYERVTCLGGCGTSKEYRVG